VAGQMHDAPFRLPPLLLSHCELSNTLIPIPIPPSAQRLTQHYNHALLVQVLRLIGSSSVLGDPTALVESVSTGLSNLFFEPTRALAKGHILTFAKDLAFGGVSFVGHSIYGVTNTAVSVSSSVGGGLASLAGDPAYQKQRAKAMLVREPSDALQGVALGAITLGKGIAEGVGGVIQAPVLGAAAGGVSGFVGGVGLGLLGLVFKPATGAVDAISQITRGVRNTTRLLEPTSTPLPVPSIPAPHHQHPLDGKPSRGKRLPRTREIRRTRRQAFAFEIQWAEAPGQWTVHANGPVHKWDCHVSTSKLSSQRPPQHFRYRRYSRYVVQHHGRYVALRLLTHEDEGDQEMYLSVGKNGRIGVKKVSGGASSVGLSQPRSTEVSSCELFRIRPASSRVGMSNLCYIETHDGLLVSVPWMAWGDLRAIPRLESRQAGRGFSLFRLKAVGEKGACFSLISTSLGSRLCLRDIKQPSGSDSDYNNWTFNSNPPNKSSQKGVVGFRLCKGSPEGMNIIRAVGAFRLNHNGLAQCIATPWSQDDSGTQAYMYELGVGHSLDGTAGFLLFKATKKGTRARVTNANYGVFIIDYLDISQKPYGKSFR